MRFGPIFFVAVLTSFSACKSPYAGDRSQTLGAPGGAGQDEIMSHGRIEATREIRIEIDELSGIDNSVDPETGKITIISVGDSDFKIFFNEFGPKFGRGTADSASFKKVVSNAGPGSQWEGVAIDADGRFFVLEESPGVVYVIDAARKGLTQTITLDYKQEGLRVEGFEENSLGEGIALLQNGHLLILKEKNPAMLIEFGPDGDEPYGVSPETLIAKREAFKLSAGEKIKYKPLKWWRFTDKSRSFMQDLSELAVGPDGVLYALSDESNRLARLESRLRVKEDKVNIKEYWDLPKSMEHPEALTFVGNAPVVGVDTKNGRENLFIFGPLPE